MKDKETCEAFVEKISGFRDNVRVEQCGFNMSQGTSNDLGISLICESASQFYKVSDRDFFSIAP